MPKGYRFLVLAAAIGLASWCFGLGYYLAALNYPQQERYQSYRYTAPDPKTVDTTLLNETKTVEYRKPCEQPEGSDESDLCAQWKAARAAEASALWAEYSFWVGLAGILGLLGSLYYTRRAVAITSDATKDAGEALEIARINASAAAEQVIVARNNGIIERRPYMTVLSRGIVTKSNERFRGVYNADVVWKNSGQTPAHIVGASTRIYLRESLGLPLKIIEFIPECIETSYFAAKNDQFPLSDSIFEAQLTGGMILDGRAKPMFDVLLVSRVIYRSAFAHVGDDYESQYAFEVRFAHNYADAADVQVIAHRSDLTWLK
jgi:hypothetical protein